METERKPLILGTATGYSPSQVALFFDSLTRTGYRGARALLVDLSNRALLDYCEANGIEAVLIDAPAERSSEQGAGSTRQRFWPKTVSQLFNVVPRPLKPAYASRVVAPFHHISSGRCFHYLRFLQANAHRFSHALLSDVRDVAFQSDPFADIPSECLWVFQENPDQTLGSQVDNRRWIEKAYGAEGMARIKHRGILCSGTIMGSTGLLIAFLYRMTAELVRLTPEIIGAFGFDQAAHNWLYWGGEFPDATVIQNFSGAVATLGVESPDRFRFDAEDRLLNLDGRPAPVIHQYDRHPAVVQLLTAKQNGNQSVS